MQGERSDSAPAHAELQQPCSWFPPYRRLPAPARSRQDSKTAARAWLANPASSQARGHRADVISTLGDGRSRWGDTAATGGERVSARRARATAERVRGATA